MRRTESALQDFDRLWSSMTPEQRSRRFALTIAAIVAGFLKIHPFINGNGRASRLLWSWSLARYGLPAQCAIAVRPSDPYVALMDAAVGGDYRPFAEALIRALASQPAPQNL